MSFSPRISVCVATHNRCHLLAQAVESVLEQSFRDFELIISDNASVDETPKICERFLKDPRVRYYRNETDLGSLGNSRKLIYEYTQTELLTFLPDDDRYVDRDALAKLSAAFCGVDQAAFASASVRLVNRITGTTDEIIREPRVLDGETFFKGYLLNEFPDGLRVPAIFPAATLIRTEDVKRVQASLNPDIPYSTDLEMYASLALLRSKIVFLPDIVSEINWSETSESYNYGGKSLDVILKDQVAAYSSIFRRLQEFQGSGIGTVRLTDAEASRLERVSLDRTYKRHLAAMLLRKEAGNCSSKDILTHLLRILKERPAAIDLRGLSRSLLAMVLPRAGLRTLRKLRDGFRGSALPGSLLL